MVSIKWLKFLCYNFILFFNKLHFPHNVFCFTIPYHHSYSIILRISSHRRLSFFDSSSSFSFPLFFLISLFSRFSFLTFFFSFSHFVSFPQISLPFPKSAAPVLPHFLLPWKIPILVDPKQISVVFKSEKQKKKKRKKKGPLLIL